MEGLSREQNSGWSLLDALPSPKSVQPTGDRRRDTQQLIHMTWPRLIIHLAARALGSPSLARDLLRVAWRFRRRGWYHRPPFLPIPSRTYVRWRMHTAYGDHDAVPPAEDVIRYARWVGSGQ